MSTTPQSSSSSVNQPPASRPSWPRRKHRGNTGPGVAALTQAQASYGSTLSAEPAGVERSATEPVLRNGKLERLVRIHAYRLPWAKLRTYLETQLKCELSSPGSQSAMDDDYFSVWLPRKLKKYEWQAIDALRLKDPKQQKRIDDRPDVTPSRALDSDEEDFDNSPPKAGHP